jgi:hypothetical protein
VTTSPSVSEPEQRPSFFQRLAVTSLAPVLLVLVVFGHGNGDLGFVLAALGAAAVCAAIAAAVTRTWTGAVAGTVVAAVALIVLFFTLLYVACATGGCE